MTELGRIGDVQEIEVTTEDLAGKTIEELNEELLNGVHIALVGWEGDNQVPEQDFTLQYGDHLTILGRTEAVREVFQRTHPTIDRLTYLLSAVSSTSAYTSYQNK